jgi:hypothetical protein
MTVSIIACGDSAKEWHKTPYDLSIGVNDCLKWGHEVDYLMCLNAPRKFEPRKNNGYQDRLSIIKKSNPQKFITCLEEWRKYWFEVEMINPILFGKRAIHGILYHSKTSPFCAMSYAYNLGAKNIILWGVDMLNHSEYKPGQRVTEFEIEQYDKFAGMIEKDCKVWIGNENTALNKYFEVWNGKN